MQILLSFRNVAVVTVIAVAGYYGYKSFYGDIETKDIGKLLNAHRLASSFKRGTIRARVAKLYRPGKDYGTLTKALDHRSPVTQALAVSVLVELGEQRAIDKFLDMLKEGTRAPEVKEELARVFRGYPKKAAVPYLIALTDAKEERDVRVAAHDTLVRMLSTGAQIKFGDAMHQSWIEWWRDHKMGVKLP